MTSAMGISKGDFDRDAKALVSAFARYKRDVAIDSSFALCDWCLHFGNNEGFHHDSYLSHPPVTLAFPPYERDKEESIVSNQESDDVVEEEGIIQDDQCYVKDINDDDELQLLVTQWTFSIVYSSTYQSPVLYFNVQDDSGTPMGRQLLLKLLRHRHERMAYHASNDFPTDAWEFVSQEEHPVTGTVSFFLHPCQSSKRLELLTATEKHKNVGVEETTHAKNASNVLWAWMSMILPAMGHSIPSAYFSSIQNYFQS